MGLRMGTYLQAAARAGPAALQGKCNGELRVTARQWGSGLGNQSLLPQYPFKEIRAMVIKASHCPLLAGQVCSDKTDSRLEDVKLVSQTRIGKVSIPAVWPQVTQQSCSQAGLRAGNQSLRRGEGGQSCVLHWQGSQKSILTKHHQSWLFIP